MLIKEIGKHKYFQSRTKLCYVPSGTYTTEKPCYIYKIS